jgi:hypothetical protein
LFQFRLFITAYLKSIFAYHQVGARFSVKHILFLVLFPIFFIPLEIVNRLCFLIDLLLFPGFRHIPVTSPVFITGFPRSGTTHLHRLLIKDGQFTALKLWEILFAPAIIQKQFFRLIGRIDRRFGSPLYKKACAMEARLFAEARKMHHISHFEAEEDEMILIHIFASAFQTFMFPFDEMGAFADFDNAVSARRRKAIMRFYKNCIRRHLYVFGRDKFYVSKNPAFSAKIKSIYETFPDARVVCMVRSPFEAVPSAVSWMSHNLRSFHDTANTYETERILDWISHWYTYPIRVLKAYPASAWAIETYDDLVSDPKNLVLNLYRRFGFSVSADFEATLDDAARRAGTYQSRHAYALEDMGLTPERVADQFDATFNEFGFVREG